MLIMIGRFFNLFGMYYVISIKINFNDINRCESGRYRVSWQRESMLFMYGIIFLIGFYILMVKVIFMFIM